MPCAFSICHYAFVYELILFASPYSTLFHLLFRVARLGAWQTGGPLWLPLRGVCQRVHWTQCQVCGFGSVSIAHSAFPTVADPDLGKTWRSSNHSASRRAYRGSTYLLEMFGSKTKQLPSVEGLHPKSLSIVKYIVCRSLQ